MEEISALYRVKDTSPDAAMPVMVSDPGVWLYLTGPGRPAVAAGQVVRLVCREIPDAAVLPVAEAPADG